MSSPARCQKCKHGHHTGREHRWKVLGKSRAFKECDYCGSTDRYPVIKRRRHKR